MTHLRARDVAQISSGHAPYPRDDLAGPNYFARDGCVGGRSFSAGKTKTHLTWKCARARNHLPRILRQPNGLRKRQKRVCGEWRTGQKVVAVDSRKGGENPRFCP